METPVPLVRLDCLDLREVLESLGLKDHKVPLVQVVSRVFLVGPERQGQQDFLELAAGLERVERPDQMVRPAPRATQDHRVQRAPLEQPEQLELQVFKGSVVELE